MTEQFVFQVPDSTLTQCWLCLLERKTVEVQVQCSTLPAACYIGFVLFALLWGGAQLAHVWHLHVGELAAHRLRSR